MFQLQSKRKIKCLLRRDKWPKAITLISIDVDHCPLLSNLIRRMIGTIHIECKHKFVQSILSSFFPILIRECPKYLKDLIFVWSLFYIKVPNVVRMLPSQFFSEPDPIQTLTSNIWVFSGFLEYTRTIAKFFSFNYNFQIMSNRCNVCLEKLKIIGWVMN